MCAVGEKLTKYELQYAREREREREEKIGKKQNKMRLFQRNIIQTNKTHVPHPFLISTANLVIIDIT